eukprot:GEZU01015030.1.p1 GENE.GEZU01015030.1~~GEZU01015030.1.p1  ORF type:complete len:224 (+),score=60.41 GEZU01015030.1:218-889(+)
MFGLLGGNKGSTFRPKKKFEKNSGRYSLHKKSKASLGVGDLANAVKVPAGEDTNEWLAVHVVDFFNTTNLIYGSLVEECTEIGCPKMNASPKYEYLWQDKKDKKPREVSAPEYVNLLMDWIEEQLNDEQTFPSQVSTPFPKNFKSTVSTIFKRLFRVYAHIYYQHFRKIQALGEEAHLNTAFRHFIMFVFEFDLIQPKELVPLKDHIITLCGEKYRAKLEKAQ